MKLEEYLNEHETSDIGYYIAGRTLQLLGVASFVYLAAHYLLTGDVPSYCITSSVISFGVGTGIIWGLK